jgi:hypothetical protein
MTRACEKKRRVLFLGMGSVLRLSSRSPTLTPVRADRNQAGLVELRVPNGQEALGDINVSHREPDGLADP